MCRYKPPPKEYWSARSVVWQTETARAWQYKAKTHLPVLWFHCFCRACTRRERILGQARWQAASERYSTSPWKNPIDTNPSTTAVSIRSDFPSPHHALPQEPAFLVILDCTGKKNWFLLLLYVLPCGLAKREKAKHSCQALRDPESKRSSSTRSAPFR